MDRSGTESCTSESGFPRGPQRLGKRPVKPKSAASIPQVLRVHLEARNASAGFPEAVFLFKVASGAILGSE